jgi:regulatory protein
MTRPKHATSLSAGRDDPEASRVRPSNVEHGGGGKAGRRPVSMRIRALRFLARREHSRQELARKLEPHTADERDLEGLLDELQARGWLSEQRVAEQLVRAAAGRYGVRKVLEQLRDKGVDAEVVAQARIALQANDLQSARAVWRKRFGRLPRDRHERARQARFLEQRGFEPEVIRKVLGGHDE